MFVGAVVKLKKAMFPIFRLESAGMLKVVGTGFFVDHEGTFVSCAHVFAGMENANTQFGYFGQLPDMEDGKTIVNIATSALFDVAIGKVVGIKTSPIVFRSLSPQDGESLCGGGYPFAEVKNSADGIMFKEIRRYFQPTFMLDEWPTGLRPDGTHIYRILLRDPTLFGMSGGPVVDTSGLLCAMCGGTTHPRISHGVGEDQLKVESSLAISAKDILFFLDQNKIKYCIK